SNDLSIIEKDQRLPMKSARLLKKGKMSSKLIISQQDAQFDAANRPFFYEDDERIFFIKPIAYYWNGRSFATDLPSFPGQIESYTKYEITPFYHPYTTLFIRELHRLGIDGLLNRTVQTKPETLESGTSFNFADEYSPVLPAKVHSSAHKDIVDFSFNGA